MIGKTILGYTVDEKIGSGAFGTVYKVSKSNVSGTYTRALKHITLPTKKQYLDVLNSMGGDSFKVDSYFLEVLKRITGEIQIISQLTEKGCKNIVRYYENDIIETPSPKSYDIFILMEYLTPFNEYIFSTELRVSDVIKLGKDILTALSSCHSLNIIHRDIKDDNIFVDADNNYKIGDFGVSKILSDRSRAESMKGTPNYIAPEVYVGKEKYDHTVDLYSLGMVMYRLLNKSRFPFLPNYPVAYDSNDEERAFEQRISGKTPNYPVNAQNILGEVVLKAISNRNERYNSAEEFLNELRYAESKLSRDELNIVINTVIPQNTDFISIADNSNKKTVGMDIDISKKETVDSDTPGYLFKTFGNDADDSSKKSTYNKNEPDITMNSDHLYGKTNGFGDYSDILSSKKDDEPQKEEKIEKPKREKDKKKNPYELPVIICAVVVAVAILIGSIFFFVRDYLLYDPYEEPFTEYYGDVEDTTDYEIETNDEDELTTEYVTDNYITDPTSIGSHVFLNNISYVLANKKYDMKYYSNFAPGGKPDFGDYTETVNGIVSDLTEGLILFGDNPLETVLIMPFGMEDSLYPWEDFVELDFIMQMYRIKAMRLSKSDVIDKEYDGDACIFTIKDCVNPERDGTNSIHRITDQFVTVDDVTAYMELKEIPVSFVEMEYHNITVKVNDVYDPTEIEISYNISMTIEFDFETITAMGTCEIEKKLTYLIK